MNSEVITEGTSSCWGTLRAQMRMEDSHNQWTNNLLIIHASILHSKPTLRYVRQISHRKMTVYLLTGVWLNVTIHWSQTFHLQDGPTCDLQCTPTVGGLWAVCANLHKFKGASRVGHFHRPSSHNCNWGSKLWSSLLNGLTIDYTGFDHWLPMTTDYMHTFSLTIKKNNNKEEWIVTPHVLCIWGQEA